MHEPKDFNNDKAEERADCSCRKKESCPLEGRYLTKSLVYRVHLDVKDKKIETNYIGLTENSFKDRFNRHQTTFRDRYKISSTDFSKFIWDLKDKSIDNVEMDWYIVEKAPPLKNGSKRCELFLTEKYHIIFQKFDHLNQGKGLLNKCRHRNKFLLCNFKDGSLIVASKKLPDNGKKKAASDGLPNRLYKQW